MTTCCNLYNVASNVSSLSNVNGVYAFYQNGLYGNINKNALLVKQHVFVPKTDNFTWFIIVNDEPYFIMKGTDTHSCPDQLSILQSAPNLTLSLNFSLSITCASISPPPPPLPPLPPPPPPPPPPPASPPVPPHLLFVAGWQEFPLRDFDLSKTLLKNEYSSLNCCSPDCSVSTLFENVVSQHYDTLSPPPPYMSEDGIVVCEGPEKEFVLNNVSYTKVKDRDELVLLVKDLFQATSETKTIPCTTGITDLRFLLDVKDVFSEIIFQFLDELRILYAIKETPVRDLLKYVFWPKLFELPDDLDGFSEEYIQQTIIDENLQLNSRRLQEIQGTDLTFFIKASKVFYEAIVLFNAERSTFSDFLRAYQFVTDNTLIQRLNDHFLQDEVDLVYRLIEPSVFTAFSSFDTRAVNFFDPITFSSKPEHAKTSRDVNTVLTFGAGRKWHFNKVRGGDINIRPQSYLGEMYPPAPPKLPPSSPSPPLPPFSPPLQPLPFQQTCFPQTARVWREVSQGHADNVLIDSLQVGDRILAAWPDGSIGYDTVNIFSVGDGSSKARFTTLTTHDGASLTLIPTHHLAVGTTCCNRVAMASAIRVGTIVWRLGHNQSAVSARVIAVDESHDEGLFNPVLTHGGLPIVDGFVTAPMSGFVIAAPFRAAHLFATAACAATGACDVLRRVLTAGECVVRHARHRVQLALMGDGAAPPVCTTFLYIDGLECRAGHCKRAQTQTHETHIRGY